MNAVSLEDRQYVIALYEKGLVSRAEARVKLGLDEPTVKPAVAPGELWRPVTATWRPRVGDIIPKHSDASVFDALPVGTVLRDIGGWADDPRYALFKSEQGWLRASRGDVYLTCNILAARRIAYLPAG